MSESSESSYSSNSESVYRGSNKYRHSSNNYSNNYSSDNELQRTSYPETSLSKVNLSKSDSNSYREYATTKAGENRNARISTAKQILKDCEETVLKLATQASLLEETEFLQNFLKDLAVDNEEVIINKPTYATILEVYQNTVNKFEDKEKQKAIFKLIHSTLSQKALEEKRNNSALKYW